MLTPEELAMLTKEELRIYGSSKALVNAFDADQQQLLKTIATMRIEIKKIGNGR